MSEELKHELVRLTYSPEIITFELTREQGLEILEEIERLKNNWNELRKWIVNNKHNENTKERYLVVDYGNLLGKMSELKGVDKE